MQIFLNGNSVEVTEKTGLDSIRSNLTKMGLQFKRRLQHTSKIDNEITCCVEHTTSTKVANSAQILVNVFIGSNIVSVYYCIIIIIISLSSSLRSLEC
jgi:hypothetical protein